MAKKENHSANVGFEDELWKSADMLRNNMDAAEYKHVVLGLIFLKYISDSFEELYTKLERDPVSDPEDRDEYVAENVFWVPKDARWSVLMANSKRPDLGILLDNALDEIEKENRSLNGVLPKNYGSRQDSLGTKLGELMDLIDNVKVGDAESKSQDVLGRVYEYFLGKFADAEGKRGGQFFTPRSIVRVLVEMIEPYKGRVYDPCCGSGGMFVQSERFIEEHGGRKENISIFGQESNQTTWKLCKMNLAIRGINGNIAYGDSLLDDKHKNLKVDYILSNPPFNVSDWSQEQVKDDIRWKYGVPPAGNANFAWVQQYVHHLAPSGIAGFVLANGSMSSNTSGEGDIRKKMIESDLVDCMIALPGQLFYNTGIPACLWFLARNKQNSGFRDRCGEVLFIDARKMGVLRDRVHRELTDEEIQKIADTYHSWRGEKVEGRKYEDIPGFCKAAILDEIKKHDYILTPGRYVGFEETEDDGEEFEEKMEKLTADLSSLSSRL